MADVTVTTVYTAEDAQLVLADAEAHGIQNLAWHHGMVMRAVLITAEWRRRNPDVPRADEPHLFVMAAEIGWPDEWRPEPEPEPPAAAEFADDYERSPA